MHMGGEDRQEFRSCCGFLHTSVAFKIIISYYAIWSSILAITPMPFLNFYFGIAGLIACALALVGIATKNIHFLSVFYAYAVFTIFLLLYLGGYYFFVTIFYKEEIAKKFGTWFDDLFFLIHFLDVMCLLIHYYSLGIIFKNRFYLLSLTQRNGKVCTVHAHDPSSALRSDSDLA